MPENVRCMDCGYLAVIVRHSRQLVSAEWPMRQQGICPETVPGTSEPFYESTPVCFAGVIGFQGMATSQKELKHALQVFRKCDRYTEWQRGLTPKDHFDASLAKEQRNWQEQRDQAMWEFQAEQIQRSDERHREAERGNWDTLREVERGNWRRLVIAFVLGVIGTLVTTMLT